MAAGESQGENTNDEPASEGNPSLSTSGIAYLDLGKPLNCMTVAVHPGASLIAAVGGAQMLKLVNITPHGLVEKKNLRLATKVTSEVNFSINDVEWCLKDGSRNILASAASNGNIIIWDSSRDGRSSQERVIPAHPRTVNRINWHPQEEGILLSASQDTTVKLWDRRGRNYTCQSTFTPRSESVRDVQWNPSQVHLFAAACENGSVHLYDRRKSNAPLLRIMGHNGLVLALEWHLTEPFMLATGARDRTVKIWDMSDQCREDMKETYLINTVSAVNRIKWRPGYPEQLSTTSSVQGDNMIHLWNIRHPYLPLATLDGHDDVCGSITWLDTPCRPHMGGGGGGDAPNSPHRGREPPTESRSTTSNKLWSSWGAMTSWESTNETAAEKDLEEYTEYLGVWQHLVSCGRDGRVIFHSLARGMRPRDSLTPSIVALSPRGDLLTSYEKIDRSRDFIGIVLDERTANAPGIFTERSPSVPPVALSRSHSNSSQVDDDRWNNFPLPEMLSRSTSGRQAGGAGGATTPALTSSPPIYQSQVQTAVELLSRRRSNSGNLLDGSAGTVAGGGGGGEGETAIPVPPWLPRFLYQFTWDEEATPLLSPYQEEEEEAQEEGGENGDMLLLRPAKGGGPVLQPIPLSSSASVRSADQIALLAKDYLLRPSPQNTDNQRPSSSSSLYWSYRYCHLTRKAFCRHNAEMARRAGQGRISHMWEVLAILLPQQVDEDDDVGDERGGERQFSAYGGGGGGRGKDGLSRKLCGVQGATLQMLRRGLLTSVVEELLDEGDVQNCVALFEVIGSTGRELEGEQLQDLVNVSKDRIRECYLGYIELLHRLELFQAANELVAGITDKFVQQLHVTNITTYASCASCRRPVSTVDIATGNTTASPWCAKCRAIVSQCAICLQPVRGIYVWCPGCSHGGHVVHMKEWFLTRRNAVCPTGCGHVCNLVALTTGNLSSTPLEGSTAATSSGAVQTTGGGLNKERKFSAASM